MANDQDLHKRWCDELNRFLWFSFDWQLFQFQGSWQQHQLNQVCPQPKQHNLTNCASHWLQHSLKIRNILVFAKSRFDRYRLGQVRVYNVWTRLSRLPHRLSAWLTPSLAGTRHYNRDAEQLKNLPTLLCSVAFQPEMALVMHLVYCVLTSDKGLVRNSWLEN